MTYDKTKYFKIVDKPRVKTSRLIQQMIGRFSVWSWYDDKELDKQFPPPKKSTTRYFHKTAEADENLANKSAEDLQKEGIECITLRERLIMEIQYFDETGKNLDIQSFTLCAGSRYAGGGVPGVSRSSDGDVSVGRDDASSRYPELRGRQAVSPSSLNLVPPVAYDKTSLEARVTKLENWAKSFNHHD